jgi:hypothetical protein
MATQNFETLRARVQALGCQLYMDDSVDGTPGANSLGEDGPRFYIHDPKKDRHVIIGTGLDIEEWIVEHEERATAASGADDALDEPATLKAMLGEAWHTFHGIQQVAQMLWDHDADDTTHGAAFTMRQAAQRGYAVIDEAQALLAKGGAA